VKRGLLIALAVVGGLALLLFVFAGVVIGVVASSSGGARGGTVAVIEVSGVITEESVAPSLLGFSATTGAHDFLTLLHRAAADPTVGAVVVRVNSPGGGVVASSEMYRGVKDLNKDKPVVVSMGEEAASGGYYISCGASKIYANQSTTTGSIGVILHLLYLQGLYDKIGVKEDVIKSGPHKDIGSRPLTPEERTILQNLIDDAFGHFVDVVSEGRHMVRDEVLKVADGSVFSGQSAKTKGLVDELGDLKEAEKAAADLAHIQGVPRIELFENQPSLFGSLRARLGQDTTKVQVTLPQLDQSGPGYQLQYLALPPGD
jgi:protease-4